MKALVPGRPQRLTALAMAVAVAITSAGCASPFRFSPRIDTHLPQPGGEPVLAKDKVLAGNLHLALAALQDQRRLLWEAADETETMKNATALGLIGLGSAGIYRGLRGTESKGWLERAGLLASATFVGAEWLQPRARQTIYLAGANSLTCLALSTAPYEMTRDDYEKIRDQTDAARSALEALATALRLVGRYSHGSDTYYIVRGGWNKLRWASRVLESADNALGNIEAVGPRLRDMTALTASEVAKQVDSVSRDLGQLQSALTQLKPNANALMGSEVFPPPKKDDVNEVAPNAPAAPSTSSEPKKSAEADTSCKAMAPPPPVDPAIAELLKQATAAAQSASAAASAASGAASAARAALSRPAKVRKDRKPEKAEAPAAAASAADAKKAAEAEEKARRNEALQAERRMAEKVALPELRTKLEQAAKDLDMALGPVTSFVQRVSSARSALKLPEACGPATVTLLPGKRDIQLQPGESFQFLLAGDVGKASAQFIALAPSADVLDLSMPFIGTATAVRLTAGRRVPTAVNTVVRITDSKGQQSFDVTVKVCAGPS